MKSDDPARPSTSIEFNRKTRMLALWGRVCPFCNAWRFFPTSALGRRLRQRQSGCPACNAYRQVYARDEEDTEADS